MFVTGGARVRRGMVAAAAMAATAAFAAFAVAAPAHAVSELELSRDGVRFSGGAIGSIFPVDVALVPGQVVTGSFWVRNNSGEPAWLSIAVRGLDVSSPAYSSALTLGVGIAGAAARTVPLGDLTTCAPVGEPRVVQPGDAVPVAVDLALADVDGTTAQDGAAALTFVAGLSQAVGDAAAVPPCAAPAADAPATPLALAPRADRAAGDAPETGPAAGSGVARGQVPAVAAAPNTERRDDEYAILIPLAALIAGALLAVYATRRRRREDTDR